MNTKMIVCLFAAALLSTASFAEAQQPKTYRIGVLLPGGLWYEVIDGLRDGLKKLGFEEGKQYILAIRDMKGECEGRSGGRKNF
jgi:opacity protein-like surface antigen